MDKKYDITTIGMVNINLAINPVDPSIFTQDVTLIDPVVATPGGDAMNEALTAARLGSSVAIVGKVGGDLFGRHVLETVKQAGIAQEYLKVEKTKQTAVGLMLIGQDGNRNICTYRGAFESLCLDDIDFYPIKNARYVNIGSMLALKNLDGKGVREILKQAKAGGAVTSADVKQDNYHIGFEGIRPCFKYLDYFLPSYEEALYLSGEKNPENQANFFLKSGCSGVVIKLGKDGCYFTQKGLPGKHLPACPTTPVDTSGAGDNFVAGFLTGLCHGWDMEQAARFGSAVAAISIQEFGSNGAVKNFEQVMRYRRKWNY